MSVLVFWLVIWAWKDDIADYIVKIGIRIKEGSMNEYGEKDE